MPRIKQQEWASSGSNGSLPYIAEEYASAGAALAAVAADAPVGYNGLTRTLPNNWAIAEIRGDIWRVTVTYADPNQGGVIPGTRVQLEFDYSPVTVTTFATPTTSPSAGQQGIVSVVGGIATNYYGGYIGVGLDGSVQGVETDAINMGITATYAVEKASYNQAFINAVKALGSPTTKVNTAALNMNIGTSTEPNIIQFAARELRFRGMDSKQQPNGDWLCTARFAVSSSVTFALTYANTTSESLPIATGSVTVEPHDIVWFPPTNKPQSGRLVTLPAGAFVHRIYPGGDFAGLLIPSN
jgi:hypothetical protein